MMLLQLRFPEASSSGSTSIITRWTSSFSSTAFVSVTVDPFCFCLSKSLKFPLAYYPMSFLPSIDSNSFLFLSATAENFLTVTPKTFLTISLVLRILVLRRLDPRSFSYFSHPPIQNALGICSCLLELELNPLNILLPSVYDKFHYAGYSFPPRSVPSTFQYTHVSVLDSIVTLKNQTCCRILVQSLDSPLFLHAILQSIPFPFLLSSQCSQSISSIACAVSPESLRNPDLPKRDLSKDFCHTTTRFDPVLWSPARQLHFVFPVAPRGCCHHIIYDVNMKIYDVNI